MIDFEPSSVDILWIIETVYLWYKNKALTIHIIKVNGDIAKDIFSMVIALPLFKL